MFSGLGKVHRHVIDGLLEDGHEVEAGCWWLVDERGEKLGLVPHKYKVPLHSVSKNGDHPYQQVYDIIQKTKPEYVITIGDCWNFWYMAPMKMKFGFSFKWIAYLTVDSEPISMRWEEVFKHIDVLMCPSKFGCRVIEDYMGIEATHVPYGVDEEFHYLPKKQREKIRAEKGSKDKFRVMTVGTNTERKNIPSFIWGFSEFAKDKEDVVAYIHTDSGNPLGVYNLDDLINRFGMEEKIILSGQDNNVQRGLSLEAMNEEYNASDVFVSTAKNEGFGLPIIEAMACGLMPIVPDCTSMTELAKFGEKIKCRPEIGPQEAYTYFVDIKDLKDKLQKSYKLWKEGNLPQLKCRKFSKEFQWSDMKTTIKKVVFDLSNEVVIPVDVLV